MTGLPTSLPPQLLQALTAARRQALLRPLALALPAALTLAVSLCSRVGAIWSLFGLLPLLPALVFGLRAMRRRDAQWLARQLDARYPQLQDSSALALGIGESHGALAGLQRARIQPLIAGLPVARLGEALPRRQWLLSLLLALPMLAPWFWPGTGSGDAKPVTTAPATAGNGQLYVARKLDVRVAVQAPAYTGLTAMTSNSLDLRAPQDSQLQWSLRPDPQPRQLSLRFSDGQTLALQRSGEHWEGSRQMSAAALVNLIADGRNTDPIANGRIDIITDAPPQITVQQPEKTLTEHAGNQTQWTLRFSATDDYGLGDATLSVTHAHGTGEQIEFTETHQTLSGVGDRHQRRYEATIDLAPMHYEEGDDLIARISVSDQRQPEPNFAHSPALILRWSMAPFGDTEVALEGVVRNTLPAYFRSQRQIIIDTEALIADRDQLSEAELGKRANAIGNDQKILRLRYGQFLGEESEAGGSHHDDDEHDDEHDDEAHDDGDQAGFGHAEDVVHEFGHSHDHAEAATLFDPATKKILKSALDAMWRSEGLLRTVQLDEALPPENEALVYIKQVQQASRIYLARVGAELPDIDPERRLTGKLDDLGAPPDPLRPRQIDEQAPQHAWNALQRGQTPDLGALRQWLDAHPQQPTDPLALRSTLDRLDHDPVCRPCKQELRAELWSSLPMPEAGVTPRNAEQTP